MREVHEILSALDMSGDDIRWLIWDLQDASADRDGAYVQPEYADRQAKVVSALALLAEVVESDGIATGRL
jgi:hypothetical protein